MYTILILSFLFGQTNTDHRSEPAMAQAADMSNDKFASDDAFIDSVLNSPILRVRACGPMKPLVFEDQTGFVIELWNAIMQEIGRSSKVVVKPFDPNFCALCNHEEDVNIGGITITDEREGKLDFTQPFMRSGLRIAVNSKKMAAPPWYSAWTQPEIIKPIFVFLGMLFVGGLILWLVERKNQKGNIKSLSDGIHVTQTSASTQGLGDHYPVSNIGRILIALYFFVGCACITDIQSSLASIKTTNKLISSINSVDDLTNRQIGVKIGTTSHKRADEIKGAVVTTYPNDETMYTALARGNIDAVIDDSPRVLYYAKTNAEIMTVGSEFEPQEYGFAFASGHPLVERVSRAILRMKENGTYNDLYAKWFSDGR